MSAYLFNQGSKSTLINLALVNNASTRMLLPNVIKIMGICFNFWMSSKSYNQYPSKYPCIYCRLRPQQMWLPPPVRFISYTNTQRQTGDVRKQTRNSWRRKWNRKLERRRLWGPRGTLTPHLVLRLTWPSGIYLNVLTLQFFFDASLFRSFDTSMLQYCTCFTYCSYLW